MKRSGPVSQRPLGAPTTTFTYNQDLLPWLYLASIAKSLEGGQCGDGYGRSLLEREPGRFRDESVLFGTRVFGKGAPAQSEHLIARSKLRDVPANRLDMPRHINSRDTCSLA